MLQPAVAVGIVAWSRFHRRLRGNASVNDSYDDTRGSDAVPVVRVDHHQPHIVADKESRDLGVTQTPPMPVATPATTGGLSLRGNPPTIDRAEDIEGPDAVPVDSAAGLLITLLALTMLMTTTSESKDRCVTQSPLMSTTTDGLPLRENAPTSDSSDDTRGPDTVPDAAPTGNLHGKILDGSQGPYAWKRVLLPCR